MEESALGMLFSRQGGYARESDFASISTLCGLPLSAAQAFFRAVSGWKEPLEAEARRISKGDFASFWRDNIRNFQAEARLFNVLRRKGESRVRTAAIASVVKGILSPPGNDQDMIELATAMLSFSVNGKADGYTLSEAKNAKVCANPRKTELENFRLAFVRANHVLLRSHQQTLHTRCGGQGQSLYTVRKCDNSNHLYSVDLSTLWKSLDLCLPDCCGG